MALAGDGRGSKDWASGAPIHRDNRTRGSHGRRVPATVAVCLAALLASRHQRHALETQSGAGRALPFLPHGCDPLLSLKTHIGAVTGQLIHRSHQQTKLSSSQRGIYLNTQQLKQFHAGIETDADSYLAANTSASARSVFSQLNPPSTSGERPKCP